MNLFNLLFASSLTLTLGATPLNLQKPSSECDEKIEVKIEVEPSTGGQANGKVKFKLELKDADKRSQQSQYFICDAKSGRILNGVAINESHYEKLKKGDYYCLVYIGGCSKKVNFTIE